MPARSLDISETKKFSRPKPRLFVKIQGDHLSGKTGKPGNVREFETCQGNVWDYVNREMSGKKFCQGKCSKTVHY